MPIFEIVAIEKLNIDPEVLNSLNQLGLFFYALGALGIVGLSLWGITPIVHKWQKHRRTAKRKADNAIWFDTIESELHIGHTLKRIEPNSFEFFVCEITFKNPSEYFSDSDIFDEADRVKGLDETKRGVEQAVRRLNKKGKEMGLNDDLFKRSKERTSINDEYRKHIVNN